MKKIIVILLTLVLVFTSSIAIAAEDGDTMNVIADIIVLRPLGVVGTLLGGALYVISWPTAAITKSTDKTYKVLVKQPFDYTFIRPVGEIGTGL